MLDSQALPASIDGRLGELGVPLRDGLGVLRFLA